jgi:uroporphyrinogen decarboxylase
MSQTPREVVRRTLKFEHPDRIPRQMWGVPLSFDRYPEVVAEVRRRFPDDIGYPPNVYRKSARTKGEMYKAGTAVDEWGCVFDNIQTGVHGQVKHPIVDDLADWDTLRPPYEILPEDKAAARDIVNRGHDASDLFIVQGGCPRPWERYQFVRGTENALIDVITRPEEFKRLLKKIHDFHMAELEFWATTDVDGFTFMDDWGSQGQLLIPPPLWREFFKPLYKDYIDIAHAHGKQAFMHSDGYIQEVYPDLVELGLDALNSQLFCMDMPELARIAKGKLAFWGEIDRQHILTDPDPEVGRKAVRTVAEHFYDPAGGIFAQFSFDAGTNPAMPIAIYEEWARIPELFQNNGAPQKRKTGEGAEKIKSSPQRRKGRKGV